MNNIEFEQELNNLISKSIYKKLKIYNCKCTRCSSLSIANLDEINYSKHIVNCGYYKIRGN